MINRNLAFCAALIVVSASFSQVTRAADELDTMTPISDTQLSQLRAGLAVAVGQGAFAIGGYPYPNILPLTGLANILPPTGLATLRAQLRDLRGTLSNIVKTNVSNIH